MTKQGLLACDGQVTHVNQGGLVYVTLDNTVAMLAKVCDTGRPRLRGRVAV